jgi:hypothetical protein
VTIPFVLPAFSKFYSILLPLYLRKLLGFLFVCYPLIQTFASLFCSDSSAEASFS